MDNKCEFYGIKEDTYLRKAGSLFHKEVSVLSQVDYMIDLRYGQKDWDMSSALREVIANAIDTKSDYSYSWKDGVAVITDQGAGLPKSAFVMGASTKSSDVTSIGMFGEGLKMCIVTALRYGRKISIRTMDYGVEAESVYSDEYGSDMMRIYFTDLTQSLGTEVRIECTAEEYDKALGMFLQLRDGYKRLDKGLFLPAGCLCILGLTTEERSNLLFSYDLGDKSLTNRDRNVVKSRKLKEEMVRILSGVKSTEAIQVYLNGLTEHPDSEEYKISFVPKAKKAWMDVITKQYGKDTVFSSTPDGDVKAVYKGYKVLPCPTKQVREVLTSIGLKSSAMKTRALKNEKVSIRDEHENKITYPIARDYVKDWTVHQAGRELMANALDMSKDASIRFENGRCVIEDPGVGIQRKHFVIGNSGKSEDQIGVFGEGFKMASLVLARENRNMLLETVGCTYRPSLEMSKEFGTEIFCFYYEENTRKRGTVISFDATQEETDQIRSLFICFNKDICFIDKTDTIDVMDNGGGSVYVNGLFAADVKSLFSYNIKGDKSLVDSRDRNHVDDARLMQVLKTYLDTTSNVDVIDRILTGWERDPYLKEYSIVIEPEMAILWYGEVDKCYPSSCIFSTLSQKANFVAELAGYKVLKNTPPYIMQVLSNSLKVADEIAKDYDDKGIQMDDRIVFPVTSEYVSSWNDVDALRELISNAMDASADKSKIDISWKDGSFVIEDDGPGLKRENLLIGNSQSRSIGTAIGTFGEGLKLACLCLSRKSRTVVIETVGFTVATFMERSEKFHSDLLVMRVSENTRTSGTRIIGNVSEDDLNKAKALFLDFDPSKEKISDDLYSGGECGIYLNGARVCRINGIGYSYNITSPYAKRELTRDRNSFSNQPFRCSSVFQILTDRKEKSEMEFILKNLKDGTEEASAIMSCYYMMSASVKKRWKKVSMEVFPDACLPSSRDAQNTLIATDVNIKVLQNIPMCLARFLEAVGFPKAEEAVQLKMAKEKRETVIPINKLTEEERKVYDAAMRMVADEYGVSMPGKVKIVACLDDGDYTTLGQYDRVTDTVFMIRNMLSAPLYKTLGVLDHEFTHRIGGHSDRTREFENDLTFRIGKLLSKTYTV